MAAARRRTKIDAEQAVQLRTLGLSYAAIAKNLDCSPSAAHAAVTRALARAPIEESVTTLRVIEAQRLDALFHAAIGPALRGNVPSQLVCLRIHEARVRLFGLVVPTEEPGHGFEVIAIPAELMPPAEEDEPEVYQPPPVAEQPPPRVVLQSFVRAGPEPVIAWEPPAGWQQPNGHAF